MLALTGQVMFSCLFRALAWSPGGQIFAMGKVVANAGNACVLKPKRSGILEDSARSVR